MRLAIALVLASALPAQAGTGGDRAVAFVELMRENGCAMSEETADSVLGGAGYTPDEIQGFASSLLAGGRAEMSEDGKTFRLTKAFCDADPALDAEAFPEVDAQQEAVNHLKSFGMPGVRGVIAMFVKERRCSVELNGARDTVADMVDTVLIRARVNGPAGSPARAQAEAMVRDVIANPGKTYKVEDGWLTMTKCTP